MLLFLRSTGANNGVITTPATGTIVARNSAKYAPINGGTAVVPWYDIDADPEAFGMRLLGVAAADPVCQAYLARATAVWGMDFSIHAQTFREGAVQAHYLKQLKIWLSPLSGNLGSRDAHRATVDEQYARLWGRHGLSQERLREVAELPFFSDLVVAGRRDRIQIYRNVTEAARALVGEVTSWPSRTIEKIAMLSLLSSEDLGARQRAMLSVVARAVTQGTLALTHTMWEYLPYYLRGAALERVQDGVARPRVLGALHDCLNDGEDTRQYANGQLITAFQQLEGGAEYRRWRMLPPVARYQVLISDLSRMFPDRVSNGHHHRLEFARLSLEGVPGNLGGFNGWLFGMHTHSAATPHDPGQAFPHAAGWTRNEFCANVVSSRLLLAPLYAGTSGHTQGRINSWRALAQRLPALTSMPLGLVIATGYSVLWRLYYDKRTTSFHTLFETIQGSHVDTGAEEVVGDGEEGGVWSLMLAHSRPGQIDVKGFWNACVARYNKPGVFLIKHLKGEIARARDVALRACPGAIIPRWNESVDVDATGTEVQIWQPERNAEILREYEIWLSLSESQDEDIPSSSVAEGGDKALDKIVGLINDYV